MNKKLLLYFLMAIILQNIKIMRLEIITYATNSIENSKLSYNEIKDIEAEIQKQNQEISEQNELIYNTLK